MENMINDKFMRLIIYSSGVFCKHNFMGLLNRWCYKIVQDPATSNVTRKNLNEM